MKDAMSFTGLQDYRKGLHNFDSSPYMGVNLSVAQF